MFVYFVVTESLSRCGSLASFDPSAKSVWRFLSGPIQGLDHTTNHKIETGHKCVGSGRSHVGDVKLGFSG
jgi:hypothetical protein